MNRLTIFYDGICIICSREINHYLTIDKGKSLDVIDISDPMFKPELYNIKFKDFKKELHTIDEKGRIYTGVDSFIQIWSRIPRYELAAKFSQLKLVRPILILFYKFFANYIRPISPKNDCISGQCFNQGIKNE